MITFALKLKEKCIMDTTSLGINIGSEEQFIGWIIIIIGPYCYFLLIKDEQEGETDRCVFAANTKASKWQ